jgi:hypothetical protein
MKLHFYFILKKNKNLDEAIAYSHIKNEMKNQPLYKNKNQTMTTAYNN